MNNPIQIATKLRSNGFTVLKTTEIEYDVDGEVAITDEVSVQVGDNYMNVVKSLDNGNSFKFYRNTNSIKNIISDINSALGK